MSKKRFMLLILIILLVIGFASITGYLYIEGKTVFEGNNRTYDIYFSGATITSGSISGIGTKTLTFSTGVLTDIGDKSIIKYEIYNNSTEYDSNIKMNCYLKEENDTISIKSLFDNIDTNIYDSVLDAQGRKTGTIEITKIKDTDNNLKLEYICDIVTIGSVK